MLPFVFWFSLFCIFYAYLGYHLLLSVLSLMKQRPVAAEDMQPRVSLLLAVFNEEDSLEQKLRNCLELDYPKHLLEIVIVSDGSTDRTNAILKDWARNHPRIKVHALEANIGKTSCLNHVLPDLTGDIVLLTDSNTWLPPHTLELLLSPFADQQVGLVTGSTYYVSPEDMHDTKNYGLSIYNRLEKLAKKLETRTGSCVGADGAIFALRRSLFNPLHPKDINDFVLPLRVVRAGYRTVFVQEAVCLEFTDKYMQSEFQRQKRITARTLRAIWSYRDLLNPWSRPLFALKLFSHKLMKFLTPFFLIIAFAANLMLVPQSLLYAGLFFIQLVLYSLALLGYIQEIKNYKQSMNWLPYSFAATNIAMLFGWFSFLSGRSAVTWQPNR